MSEKNKNVNSHMVRGRKDYLKRKVVSEGGKKPTRWGKTPTPGRLAPLPAGRFAPMVVRRGTSTKTQYSGQI